MFSSLIELLKRDPESNDRTTAWTLLERCLQVSPAHAQTGFRSKRIMDDVVTTADICVGGDTKWARSQSAQILRIMSANDIDTAIGEEESIQIWSQLLENIAHSTVSELNYSKESKDALKLCIEHLHTISSHQVTRTSLAFIQKLIECMCQKFSTRLLTATGYSTTSESLLKQLCTLWSSLYHKFTPEVHAEYVEMLTVLLSRAAEVNVQVTFYFMVDSDIQYECLASFKSHFGNVKHAALSYLLWDSAGKIIQALVLT